MVNGGLQPSSTGTSLRYGCLLLYHLIRLTAQCAITSVDILCPNAGISGGRGEARTMWESK
jgi:hypothetical protein